MNLFTISTGAGSQNYQKTKSVFAGNLPGLHNSILKSTQEKMERQQKAENEIANENAESDRELALIKDSYANSMVPFLAHHYKKIYVFDTRYYKLGPSSFIKGHEGVTDVLVLYNLNTVDTDLGIRGIY